MGAQVIRLDAPKFPPDDVLIARVAGRDAEAFRLLGERYSGLIFSVAYRMLNNRNGAEDIVQDVLCKLWIHAGLWQRERGASVKTWLCRIAGNACIDAQRKDRHETVGEVPEIADAADNAEGQLRRRQTGAIVGQALQALPERQRLAVVMFHYEEASVAEIAVILGVTPKAAEGLLTRGRSALRFSLESRKGLIG